RTAFDADACALDAQAAVHARLLGLDDDAATAAARVARRVLAHDLLRRAADAHARGACRRETPVTCLGPDEILIEGVVALAFEEPDGWTVVDYKTDRELMTLGEDRYRRQVALYADAISRATGRPASGIIVRL